MRSVVVAMLFAACSGEPAAVPVDVPSDVASADRTLFDAPFPADTSSAVDAGILDVPVVQPDRVESGVPDVPAMDVPSDTVPDAPPYDPCAPGVLRDLDALGTRTGETTTVLGDNLSAGRAQVLPCACAAGYAGYQVVYRYVPRRSTALRFSTNFAATDARLDSVVEVLSACSAADGGAATLGCNDDTGDPPRDHASTYVTDVAATAGTPVYVVVAGFLHATHDLFDSQGRFELTVTEQ